MHLRALLALALATTAAGALAPAAQADDAGVFAAYNARQANELDPAAVAYARAAKRSRRSGTDRAYRSVIRADRAMNAVLARIGREVKAQRASSETGGGARRAALAEVRAWLKANRLEIRALRAVIAGRRTEGERLVARADRTMRRQTYPSGRRAVRRFKAVGLSSPVAALSS